MSAGLVLALVVLGSVVYGAGWIVTALVWISTDPHKVRHTWDGEPVIITDQITAAAVISAVWPLIWPAVLALAIHHHRAEAATVEAKVAAQVEARLAQAQACRDRAIADLEHDLGIGP